MVLTKEAFLNHLYGGMDEPEMKIIDVFICKLRKKLVQAGADNLIGTVWGRGYMVREPSADPMALPEDAMADDLPLAGRVVDEPMMADGRLIADRVAEEEAPEEALVLEHRSAA